MLHPYSRHEGGCLYINFDFWENPTEFNLTVWMLHPFARRQRRGGCHEHKNNMEKHKCTIANWVLWYNNCMRNQHTRFQLRKQLQCVAVCCCVLQCVAVCCTSAERAQPKQTPATSKLSRHFRLDLFGLFLGRLNVLTFFARFSLLHNSKYTYL